MSTNREDVYEAIDSERNYQDFLASDRTDGSEKTVGEYIVMLHHYLRQADKEWTLNPGTGGALEVVRKIAGIAVHCMEDHGAPHRRI